MNAREIIDALKAAAADLVWCEELRLDAGTSRADFWTLAPTPSQGFRSTMYEVKISKGDFRRDSEAKQAAALRYSDRFWYVTPPGLIDRAELPAWAGLMEFDGERLRIVVKAPPRRKAEPDWGFVALALRCSADRGRDVALMKSEILHLRAANEYLRASNAARNERTMRRFMRIGEAVMRARGAGGEEPPAAVAAPRPEREAREDMESEAAK